MQLPCRYDTPVSTIEDGKLGAWRTLLEAHARVTQRLAAELEAETGLPLSWYDVLYQLYEAPGQQLRMLELADAVLLSKSGLTRLVDRMAAESLVERVPCEDDARGFFVHLTAAGQQRFRRAAPVHLAGIEQHFANLLGNEEAQELNRILGPVADAAKAATSRGSRAVPSARAKRR